ncbi:MAG TPA: type III pantothenate kinase [Bacteroidales bacterium]|nr:type III pantothenate kinase [Bacteroidales bacterium]HPT20896.1 type III pantothenate kinase [Bacteroidales bacterium]
MNLVFDIGNSSSKMAVYDGRTKIAFFRTKEFSFEKLHKKMSKYHIDKAIVCSVKDIPEFIIDIFKTNYPVVHFLSHESKLPFSIDYETPETLGPDRIAAVAGAYAEFPGKDVFIIDAGTAITYEFLSENIYRGGNISPGLNMRFKALNRFTGKLPLVSPADNYTSPGRNTNDAIMAGVVTGITYEINEYIRAFEKKHTDFKVVLTGGDSEYLKNKIEHNFTWLPDIVVSGLNFILEYNA